MHIGAKRHLFPYFPLLDSCLVFSGRRERPPTSRPGQETRAPDRAQSEISHVGPMRYSAARTTRQEGPRSQPDPHR